MTTWKDILLFMASSGDSFRTHEIAKGMGLVPAHVSVVILRLRGMSMIRYVSVKERGWGGYELTESGKRVVDDLKKGVRRDRINKNT